MNTLMLAVWLATLFLRVKVGRFFSSPATWFRGKDPVNQAVFRLYADEWRQPSTRWIAGATSHSLWLCTPERDAGVGIAAAFGAPIYVQLGKHAVDHAASVRAVEMLAWLPSKLGFPAPDARAVVEGRLNGNIADARAWSGLLVGSIACYGMPRLLAGGVQNLLKQAKSKLDLEKPYYQAVIRRWQNKIVDADTRRETVSAVSPKITLNDAPKWQSYWKPNGTKVHGLRADWRRNGWIKAWRRIGKRLPLWRLN